MGDRFSNISNSTIVNRSLVQGAIGTLQQGGNQDSAEALRKLAEMVEQSGNSDATEYLNGFTEELEKPEPRRTILRSMWEGIKTALPVVSQAIEVTTGIDHFLTS